MPIDRMDWHYNGDFPDDLPLESGGTHIGLYLTWIINNNLVSGKHLKEDGESIDLVKRRQLTGRDFLMNVCDEEFGADDLNEEGLKFTRYYYGDENDMKDYIIDYLEALAGELESVYHVSNTWDNYDKISKVIDRRYTEWKQNNS
jgi:hypothetical protein